MKVSPFRLLAYQKVCSDFYRIGNYESSRIGSYNIDSQIIFTNNFTRFAQAYLQLRYRPWKKDRYTISSPSFQGTDYMSSIINAPILPSAGWFTKLEPYSELDYTGNIGTSSSAQVS